MKNVRSQNHISARDMVRWSKFVVGVLASLSHTCIAVAQEPLPPAAEGAAIAPAEVATETASADPKSWTDAFGFGAGIAVTYNSDDLNLPIGDELVSGGKVALGDVTHLRAGLWLELHYSFGTPWVARTCLTLGGCRIHDGSDLKTIPPNSTYWTPRRFYHGPFFGLRAGQSVGDLISGVGLGYMVSWRVLDEKGGPTGRSFNLGVGPAWTQGTRIADGLKDGSAVSAGQVVRIQKFDAFSPMLMLSTSF